MYYYKSSEKMKSSIQFPLDCESILRSKSITTGTAGFFSSSCANYSQPSKARAQNVAAMPLKGSVARASPRLRPRLRDQRARCPSAPPPGWPCLLFQLYSIPHRHPFGFGHRTEIGSFSSHYPVRPCFVFPARFCTQLELDELACAALALDDNQKVAIKSLREQRGFARNENVVIATCDLVVIEQCVTVIPAVCIKTGVQRLLAWLGRQL